MNICNDSAEPENGVNESARQIVIFLSITLGSSIIASASQTLSSEQLNKVSRARIDDDNSRQQIERSAVLLAYYEIEAKKLLRMAENDTEAEILSNKAQQLMEFSEVVIDSARFRLPQCDDYLAQSIALKEQLDSITHARLESDYHHDGALPDAPAECYHAKDLFVHPATVKVLTRDDPALGDNTRTAIKAEIAEVLAHTEYVRQLVMY